MHFLFYPEKLLYKRNVESVFLTCLVTTKQAMDFKGFICILVLYISNINGAAQNIVETRPIASPAIPAPADTIVQQKIAAPFRTHPRITNIVPQINIQNYDVDVPIPVPHAVLVPAPYKDHAVQEIVESPHIHHATVETHSSQPVVTTHASLVHAGEVEDNKEAL